MRNDGPSGSYRHRKRVTVFRATRTTRSRTASDDLQRPSLFVRKRRFGESADLSSVEWKDRVEMGFSPRRGFIESFEVAADAPTVAKQYTSEERSHLSASYKAAQWFVPVRFILFYFRFEKGCVGRWEAFELSIPSWSGSERFCRLSALFRRPSDNFLCESRWKIIIVFSKYIFNETVSYSNIFDACCDIFYTGCSIIHISITWN